ncbi:MAG: ACT domain-containing protein [Ruminococcus sp.]|jgi:hypothetical protein|nr:ACT domain-containing protein [Ruminococcus sp.]
MNIQKLDYDLTVCKVSTFDEINTKIKLFFISRTDEEISLVCPTKDVPLNTCAREDGWKAFRICGTLDFSLIGILSKITYILARHNIGVFAVSTYNTDYILVKKERFDEALSALNRSGYTIV